MAKSYFHDGADWRELVKGEQGEQGERGLIGPVGPEGPQGPMGTLELIGGDNPAITVDNSVGTRVFIGDTMIHGDTGWRNIEDLLNPGWVIPAGTRYALLRRVGDLVYLRAWLRFLEGANNSYVLDFPSGFRPPGYGSIGSGRIGNTPTIAAGVTSTNQLNLSPSADNGNDVMLNVLFQTKNNWPTSLPGTPD